MNDLLKLLDGRFKPAMGDQPPGFLQQALPVFALDRHGTLYVAVNALDRIATVDFRGNVATYVEGTPLDAPSSVVFGTRPADRHSLFLTSFSLYRANGLKPGSPQPALQSVPVPFGGVDLD